METLLRWNTIAISHIACKRLCIVSYHTIDMPSFKKMLVYHYQLTTSLSLEVVNNVDWQLLSSGPILAHAYGPSCDIMTWRHFPHYWPFVRGIHCDILHGFPTPNYIPYLPYLTRHPYINAACCPGGHVWDYYTCTLSTDGNTFAHQMLVWFHLLVPYRQTFNTSHTLVCNKIVDHSYVVGAPPVGAASTTSSFHLNPLLRKHTMGSSSRGISIRSYMCVLCVWCVIGYHVSCNMFVWLT